MYVYHSVKADCSLHRSQGLTLDSAVIDLSTREFAPGLAFVALTRVRALEGLFILSFFPFDRICDADKHTARIQEEQRIINIAQATAVIFG